MIISPLPEAIDGHKWTVQAGPAGGGSIDTTARRMIVPVGNDDSSRFIRAHEMAHGVITPRIAAYKQCVKHEITMDALQACEDLRVHHFLKSRGIRCVGSLSDEQAHKGVDGLKNNPRALAALLVSSLHTMDWERLLIAVHQLDEEYRDRLLDGVRLIDKRLQSGKGIDRPIGLRNCTAPAARLFDALFGDEFLPDDEAPGNVPLKELGMGKKKVSWGKLVIAELPLTHTRRAPCVSRARSYRDEGAMLSAVHRLPVDGRIFARTKSHQGGTVLIDISGSMRFSQDDLVKILTAAPAATVATYSGHGRVGVLTIVAQKGRMATGEGLRSARSNGSGNIVDGPALDWLSTQSEPRLWISDGVVTGVHDHTSLDLGVDAQRICRKANIRRVLKASAASQRLMNESRR